MTNDGRADDSTLPRSVFWFLALWVALVLFALVWGVDNAETTLREAAGRRLAAGDYNVVVDFSGRDARLIGSVPSKDLAQEIEALIDALPGVREVNNGIVVVEPEPPTLRSPQIAVRLIGDAVSVRGVVPSAEVEADLIEAAAAQFGSDRVVNALAVLDDVESPPWLGRIQDVFAHLGELRSGGFTASPQGVVIEGEVISEAARDATIDDITLVLDELLPVTGNITIAVLPPPTFSASGADGTVILRGVLPNQETIDRVEAAAQRLHGAGLIINLMNSGEVAGPMWLETIDGLLDVVTRLNPWTIDIDEGNVLITGLGIEQDLVAAVDVLAAEIVDGQLSVVTSVEVNPEAVAIQLTQLLEGSALFALGGTELSDEGIALLDSAIAILQANTSTFLIVEGHTDNEGDADFNKDLSQQWVDTVVAYLIAGGIEADRLTPIGYGEERPIADNVTSEGRVKNRRIEFVIQEGEG